MDEYQIPVSGEQINTTQIRTEQTQQQRDITRAINFQEDPWIKPEDYANRDKRTDKEIARFIKETSKQLEEDELLDETKRMEVHERLKKYVDLNAAVNQQMVRDEKWYNFFKKDSPQMTYVKQALNYLNNQMDQALPINAQTRRIDCKAIDQMLQSAYATVLEACEQYINSHQGKRHATGRRRLKNVMDIREMIQSEQNRLALALSNVQDQVLHDQRNAKTVRDLFSRVKVNEAVVSREMDEGNSSKVDRVKLRAGSKYYYAKEDLMLLNEDFPGYLDRRLDQLQKSMANRAAQPEDPAQYEEKCKAQDELVAKLDEMVKNKTKLDEEFVDKLIENNAVNKERKDELLAKGELSEEEADQMIHNIRKGQEERRLRGRMDEADYQGGLDFLNLMKNKLASKSGDEKETQKKRYLKFLGHDFDRVFKELSDYNMYIEKCKGDREELQKTLEVLKADMKGKTKNKGKNAQNAESPLIEMLEQSLKNADDMKTKTPYEYICDLVKNGKMGLDLEKDRDVLDVLKNLQLKDGEKNVKSERIKRLFTRTLGKEAELYGQQCERSGIDDSAILASNNTATSRLAKFLGFLDVVTTSFKCMMKNREDKGYKMYTLSEEAEGEEMLTLVDQAEKAGAKLHYSPNAVQQLMRLQLFDTLCLQTDRHWRNFKCKVAKKGKTWTILSLKAYDHDQSFGAKSLAEYFKEQEESMGKTQMGFINPYVMTISKEDKRYIYLKRTRIGGKDDQIIRNIRMPDGQKYRLPANIVGIGKSKKSVYENAPGVWSDYFLKQYGKLGAVENCMRNLNQGKEKELKEFWDKFQNLLSTSRELARIESKEKRRTRKDETEKDVSITGILRQLREVKALYDQLNFVGMEAEAEKLRAEDGAPRSCLNDEDFCERMLGSRFIDFPQKDGFFDYMIQCALHCIKTRYASNPANMAQLEDEDAEDQIRELQKKAQCNPGASDVPADDKLQEKMELCGIGKDTLRMPTILHMDAKAFRQIQRVAGDDSAVVDGLMRELGWDEKKRNALITRAKELVEQILEAEKIVNAWNDMNGVTDPIKRKFFLEDDDYKKITKLTDFVTDPSMTYFSVEDPNFLVGEEKYANLMTERDKKAAIKETNEGRKHVRQRLEPLKDEYKQMVSNDVSQDSELNTAI